MKIKRILGITTGIVLLSGNAILAQEVAKQENQTISQTSQTTTSQTTEALKNETTTVDSAKSETPKATTEKKLPEKTGWVLERTGQWFYYDESGEMVRSQFIGRYYLKENGVMADNEWIFDHSLNSWFFIKPGGQFARNQWKGSYYLKDDGKMTTSEFIYDPSYNATYYLDSDGVYVSGKWFKVNGVWYHFDNSGKRESNKWIGSYYLKQDGSMAEDELIYDQHYKAYFYLAKGGAYVGGNQWATVKGEKRYFKQDGEMAVNKWIGSYYVDAEGKVVKNNWIYDGNYSSWFFLDPDGIYVGGNRWYEVSGEKFYFKSNGSMAASQWVGSYYVGKDGRIVKNNWIYDSNYGSWFYLDADGIYVGGNKWYEVSGEKFYFKADGQMAANEWIGNYYVKGDGRIAKSEWVDKFRYYVDSEGLWVPDPGALQGQKGILLSLARQFIGVNQFDDAHRFLVNLYNSGVRSYSGYRVSVYDDWCDIYVSSMYQLAGIIQLIDKEAYVPFHIQLMKNKGIWIGRSTPQAGDIVTFDWQQDGDSDNIGIVEKVENGRIYTLEGNTSDHSDPDLSKFVAKSYPINYDKIVGFGRPQYR